LHCQHGGGQVDKNLKKPSGKGGKVYLGQTKGEKNGGITTKHDKTSKTQWDGRKIIDGVHWVQ